MDPGLCLGLNLIQGDAIGELSDVETTVSFIDVEDTEIGDNAVNDLQSCQGQGAGFEDLRISFFVLQRLTLIN